MSTREHINEHYNGRGFLTLSVIALVVATIVALSAGVQPPSVEGHGVFFSCQRSLIGNAPLSAVANVLCLLITGGILLAINKVFTFVRSVTRLFVSSFFWLQLANPSGLVALHVGTLLCLMTAMLLLPLFASFQDRHSQRSIFLVFALVATGSMFHYGFVVLLPAFLLGFLNMGVMNLKGLLAMLFGLVTPFWIVLGLGIARPTDAMAPQWLLLDMPALTPLLWLAAAMAVLGIVLAAMNLPTIMNYRLQPRVYNAFFVIVLVLMVITMCFDHRDLAVYLPLLGLMVAVQVAQVHTLRTYRYRYIFLLLLIVGCAGSYAYHLMLS